MQKDRRFSTPESSGKVGAKHLVIDLCDSSPSSKDSGRDITPHAFRTQPEQGTKPRMRRNSTIKVLRVDLEVIPAKNLPNLKTKVKSSTSQRS